MAMTEVSSRKQSLATVFHEDLEIAVTIFSLKNALIGKVYAEE